ncbi:doublecortin domain-containing protein 1-like [Protopterus annectens]|uniref:doublecortin domain-containing protein 1-like n=1 Tax=Protopterus annectens TaxID=7888 RepID=UPI001CFC2D27|nr:doublecortin domain-containing protein 1-like [Protopterus annectens]
MSWKLLAYPEFVLTYLEELNAKEEVAQTENHSHFGAWATAHQETDSSSTEEVLQTHVSSSADKQLSGPFVAHQMPEGSLMESSAVTVALLRKLEEKHPKASAQRWAIKHEGTSKPRQWKHSKVENPLWNKLAYMWPVLPDGQLNEKFEWPIEGSLISNSPTMKKPYSKKTEYVPAKLKVLRNGDYDLSRATIIIGPDITNMLDKQ